MFISIVNEGRNYYSKPRNVCCEKKSDTRLNKEVSIFVLQELSVFGPHHVKLSVTSYRCSQQVSWHELWAIPVKQTIMGIATN